MLIIFRFHCVIYDLKLFSKAFIFGVNKGLLSKCLKEVYRLHKTQGLTQHYHKRQPVGGKAEGRHILGVEVADQSTASSMAKVIQRMIWTLHCGLHSFCQHITFYFESLDRESLEQLVGQTFDQSDQTASLSMSSSDWFCSAVHYSK